MQRKRAPLLQYRGDELPLGFYLFRRREERLVAAQRVHEHALVCVRHLPFERVFGERECELLWRKAEIEAGLFGPKADCYRLFGGYVEREDVLVRGFMVLRAEARRRLEEHRYLDDRAVERFAALKEERHAAPAVVVHARIDAEIGLGL